MPTLTENKLATDPLLTVEDITTRLRISRQMFSEMLRRGEFPPGIRLGRRFRRWPESTFTAWMNAGGCARKED